MAGWNTSVEIWACKRVRLSWRGKQGKVKTTSPKTHINVIRKKTNSQNKCKSGVRCVREARSMRLIKINKSMKTQDTLIWSSKKERYWDIEVIKQGRVGSVSQSFLLAGFFMFSVAVTFCKPWSYACILRKIKMRTMLQPSKYHFIITGGRPETLNSLTPQGLRICLSTYWTELFPACSSSHVLCSYSYIHTV